MSLINWLFPTRKAPKASRPQMPDSSGLSRMEATRPVRHGQASSPQDNAQPANRKHERMARRELLYNVVRQAMTRAGILSSAYKFKVLSLDGRGRQFLVMIDLAHGQAGNTVQLAEVEALIAQAAKARHDIVVTAVYWRSNDHVAVGEPLAAHAPAESSQPAALISEPAPLAAALREPDFEPTMAPMKRGGSRYEPIQADEVAAFKQALANGTSRPAPLAASAPAAPTAAAHGASAKAFDGSARHGPQSYTLLTGFEDTELPDADRRNSVLSGTQYGELR
jgi:hypothetical protein